MASPRTQFYHPARLIEAALAAVERAIRRAEGIALVVGPPGTGKSLLLAKVAESVGEDFRVALLSGARICTRRALWQAILAELGQPYRGIDEGELRIAVVELARGLAAAGSGLVILVDEAHTLPLRLIEELRLLTNIPTPLPAVHVVLTGTMGLEERLGAPKMESFAQRIAVRSYLEPLDHAEAVAYLRTQTRAAGLEWDKCFEPGCDDAAYGAADGVPRLLNQVCDQALVAASAAGRRARPADIAAAWQEIQRLPAGALLGVAAEAPSGPSAVTGGARGIPVETELAGVAVFEPGADDPCGVVEFGSLDDEGPRSFTEIEAVVRGFDSSPAGGGSDPWHGPDVEFVFDAATDPFQEFFEQEEQVVERYLVQSPGDFSRHPPVASGEGAAIVRQLLELGEATPATRPVARPGPRDPGPPARRASAQAETAPPAEAAESDDADMVVIEEDLLVPARGAQVVEAVRLGDYRRLFARLRRGG